MSLGLRGDSLAGWFDSAKLRGLHKAMIWIAAVAFGSQAAMDLADGIAKEKVMERFAPQKSSG